MNHASSIPGKHFLQWRKKMLTKGGRKVDFDWLLDMSAGISWTKLQKIIMDPEVCILLEASIEELEIIWVSHLKEHIPLQYLISKCPWRDFELEVTSAALIPRQETELMIEFALEKVKNSDFGRWADLGTGAGPLAIALAKSLPDWNGHAVDISQGALKLAKRNLNSLVPESKVEFCLGNWWEPLSLWWGSFDLVLSNPPYIPSKLIEDLEPVVKKHEPRVSLDGGDDGMKASKEIIIGAIKGLSKGGWLILEHHHDQSESITNFMKQCGMEEVTYEKDLNGINRYAICRNSKR
tara:strand:+ start:989 stop:1870 length:882 start_codon:yes stop_codon:yes gene_type:complete